MRTHVESLFGPGKHSGGRIESTKAYLRKKAKNKMQASSRKKNRTGSKKKRRKGRKKA